MTLIKALKTEKPIRRKSRAFSYEHTYPFYSFTTYIARDAWIDPHMFFNIIKLNKEDILAKDWEAKE
jgi:hypothetical protein